MTNAANVALRVVLRSSSLRVTRKCMRAGLSPKSPALLVDSGGPHGHAKPTQSYPLIVVPVLVFGRRTSRRRVLGCAQDVAHAVKESFSEVRAATTTALLWRSFTLCVILHTWRAKKGGDHSSE